ncbi:MAG: TolC family protein [Bacteroidales bacterium]
MMWRVLSGSMFFLMTGAVFSQIPASVTLTGCYDSARGNYPVFRENALLQESLNLKIKNLNASWYPQVSFGAQAAYYSDITELDVRIPLPGVEFPRAPHEQYRIFFDISQTVWDGGASREQKLYEQKTTEAAAKQLETEMQQLRERINSLYFLILFLKENEHLYELSRQTLVSRLTGMEAAVKAGAAMAVQKNQIQAEILRTEQLLEDVRKDRKAALDILGILTGMSFSDSTVLKVPVFHTEVFSDTLNRPEMEVFNLLIAANQQLERALRTRNYPRIVAFAQAGYGNPPGMNLLRNEWDFYWSAGVGLKWNLWDWNTLKHDIRMTSIQGEKLAVRKETFVANARTQLAQERTNILKFREAVLRSEEIVRLHHQILSSMASGLENGIITATDYLAEHNTLLQAEISRSINRLQLLRATLAYYTIQGNVETKVSAWEIPVWETISMQ